MVYTHTHTRKCVVNVIVKPYRIFYVKYLYANSTTARAVALGHGARTCVDEQLLLFEMLLVLLGGPVFVRKAYRQKDYTSRKVKPIGIAASGTSTGRSERPPLE